MGNIISGQYSEHSKRQIYCLLIKLVDSIYVVTVSQFIVILY